MLELIVYLTDSYRETASVYIEKFATLDDMIYSINEAYYNDWYAFDIYEYVGIE